MLSTFSGLSQRQLYLGSFSLLLAFMFLAIFPSSSASAASIYDDAYQTTDSLILSSVNQSSYCSETDVTINWSQYIQDEQYWHQYSDHFSQFPALRTSFQTALSSGSWGVSMQDSSGEKSLLIFWQETTQMTLNWYDTAVTAGPVKWASIGCDTLGWKMNTDVSEMHWSISNNTGGVKNFFVNTTNLNIPADYAGPTVNTGDVEEVDKPDLRPDFTYQVHQKKIKAHDYQQNLPLITPDEGYTIEGYKVEWSLFKCAEYDEVTNACTPTNMVDHQILKQDQEYTFDVDDHSDYVLRASYLVEQCYRYPSYPATPDHCFYVDLSTELPDYDVTETAVHIKVDGTSFTGDTKGLTCDVNGFCEKMDENCSLQPNFMATMNCRYNKALGAGLLNPSINAFKNLFSSLIVVNPQCHIPMSDVKIMDGQYFPLSSYSGHACTSAEQFRDAFPIAPLLLNFFLAMFMLFMLVKIFNRITDDRKNDIIEGVA